MSLCCSKSPLETLIYVVRRVCSSSISKRCCRSSVLREVSIVVLNNCAKRELCQCLWFNSISTEKRKIPAPHSHPSGACIQWVNSSTGDDYCTMKKSRIHPKLISDIYFLHSPSSPQFSEMNHCRTLDNIHLDMRQNTGKWKLAGTPSFFISLTQIW